MVDSTFLPLSLTVTQNSSSPSYSFRLSFPVRNDGKLFGDIAGKFENCYYKKERYGIRNWTLKDLSPIKTRPNASTKLVPVVTFPQSFAFLFGTGDLLPQQLYFDFSKAERSDQEKESNSNWCNFYCIPLRVEKCVMRPSL